MKQTKQTYVMVANVLRNMQRMAYDFPIERTGRAEIIIDTCRELAKQFAGQFAIDNPKFNRNRFMEAALVDISQLNEIDE